VSTHEELEQLTRGLERGTVGRREFVRRAGALGLSLSAVGSLLLACQRKDRGPASGEALADLGPIEKELNIYNWSDYIAPETVPNFEKEFGVKVTYDTYESNEEMVAKLQAGAKGYDIVVPSGYIVPVLVATGLIAPVNRRYIPNWKNVAPIFVNPVLDPDNAHTVPWQWGTTGYAYRKDRIPGTPDSWAIFFDAKYKGKMTQMDDGREVLGAMLRYRGHSLNSIDPAELKQAKEDAIATKKQLKAYISAPVKGQLIAGDVWVAQLWNGDTEQARAEQPNIAYCLPKEGCTIWTDSLCIPKSAPHKRAAHEFMNYILRPDVGAGISNKTGYGSPNQPALALMKHPVQFPTADEMKRLEYQVDLGEHTAEWDRLWTEIKSA
jgi:spermidine/putrescine transport system substrate-binding protein